MRQVFLVLLAVGIMMVECPVWVLAQDGTSWQGQGNRVASTTTSLDTGVSSGKAVASGTLPRGAGQVFREYDISQYTSKVQGVEQPQQAVIDWVMRQTGTEVWFGEPFGFLSATREKILVYHTPEMQKIVAEIVDRFAQGAQESNVFGLRLIALDSPDWRAMGQTKLTPVSVQTPGVDAWLVSKEDAAMLLAALRRRTDFREHSSPSLAIHNGQTHTLSQKQPRTYVRGVQPRLGNLGGYDLVMGQVFEGFKLEMSPLMSRDQKTVDAVVSCQVERLEQFVPVSIEVPGYNRQVQSVQIQTPQMSSWALKERFRWPSDKVLLLSRGVVASPGPTQQGLMGVRELFTSTTGRAEVLLFLESRGKASENIILPGREGSIQRETNPRYRLIK